MKKAAIVIVALVATAFPALLPAKDARGPKIEARELTYDCGKVAAGTQVSHIFKIHNTGNEPLIIDRVVPS